MYHRSAAGKIVAASLLTVGGGLGGTILYAKWDPKFRTNIEKSVPYSDMLFELMLGPPPPPPLVPLAKKPVGAKPVLQNQSTWCPKPFFYPLTFYITYL